MCKCKILIAVLGCVILSLVLSFYVHGYDDVLTNIDEPVVFTYEQALELATADMMCVLAIDDAIRELQFERRHLSYEVRRLGGNNAQYSSDATTGRPRRFARFNLNELDRQIDDLQMQQEQSLLAVEHMLRQNIAALAEQAILISAGEMDLAVAEYRYTQAEILYYFGRISSQDLLQARRVYTQYYTALHELIIGRDIAMQGLNDLLRQPLYQHTLIEFEMDLPETPEYFLLHLDRLVQSSVLVFQAQQALAYAMDERWAYTGNNRDINISNSDRRRAWELPRNNYPSNQPQQPSEEILRIRNRLALQEAVERANISLEQAEGAARSSIMHGYSELEILFIRTDALMYQLHFAEDMLRLASLNYQLGLVTSLDVKTSSREIYRIQHELEVVNIHKWRLAFVLSNPSLL